MSQAPPRPTNAELAILRVIWALGASTVRQVHEALPEGQRRGYTTTLKLMQIMAEKRLLDRDASSRSHVYTALVAEQDTQGKLVGDLMAKAFGGSAASLVMRALSDQPATRDELADIRKLIDELDRGTKR